MNGFLEEVVTEGKVLKALLDYHRAENPTKKVADLFRTAKYKRILFAGMGSSFYAPYTVVDYLISKGIPSIVLNAFEASRYQFGMVSGETLLVAISQSGKSKEVMELIRKSRGHTNIVGIVNKEDSLLALEAEYPVFMKAGPENFISNKSFMATLAVCILLAADIVGELDDRVYQPLYELADWMDKYLTNIESNTVPLIKFIEGATNIDFLANGPSISTSMEAGLTFREGPHITTAALNTADYAHGWDRSVKEGYVGVISAPGYDPKALDPALPNLLTVEARMIDSIHERGGKVVLITDSNIASTDKLFVIKHPQVPERMASLAQTVPCNCMMGWMMGDRSR
jgi:glucosamine--fructose-6-phosphate aminotransferase (isomerizing)